MTLIYQLAEGPEGICAQILQGCAKQAQEKLEEKNPTQEDLRKWARGAMGPLGSSQLLLLSPPGQKPLPLHFPLIVVQSYRHSPTPIFFFTSFCCTGARGRSVNTGCRVLGDLLLSFLLASLSTPPEDTPTLPAFLLMNLLSLAGDVALQQLVHLEQAVSGELCRRRVLREEQEHKTKNPKEKVNGAGRLGSCPMHFPDLFHDLWSLSFPLGVSASLQ